MEHSQPAACAYHANQVLSLNIESSHGFLKAHLKPWTPRIEESYTNFLQSGRAASFLDKLSHEEDFRDAQGDWGDAENEVFLSQELLSLYTAETTTYESLQDCQGKILPRLLAKATLDLVPDTPVPSDMVGHM
ncbi:hypothetical protein MY8738_007469 [Beauveria namnaoensis]